MNHKFVYFPRYHNNAMNLYLHMCYVTLLINLIVVTAQTNKKHKLVPYSIPENRELKKSLGYEEDTYLNFTELTTKYHFSSEQHSVITDDGYVLTLFRIRTKCSEVKFYPVLLMHGILDSSDLWILSGPETGLGYILSNNCYDVWLANHRGNRYSRKHIRLNPDTDAEYWNYSFDEHGNYDVPAFIGYILNTRKRPRLYYIGHSQGTTNFFVMNSLRPEYNEKIRLSIQLAPVAWLGNYGGTIIPIAALGTEAIRAFLQGAGYNEFLAKDQILHSVLELLCQKAPVNLCGFLLNLAAGYQDGVSPKTLRVAFGHLLVGISIKDLAHFGQLILSHNFQRYDEGRAGNLLRYGVSRPPKYNVSKVTAPVVLVNAQSDYISSLKDANILRSRLPNVIEDYVVPEKYWSHHNHIYGIKTPVFVFPKILDYFNLYDDHPD